LWFGTASVDSRTPFLLAFVDHNGTKPTGTDGSYIVAAVKSNGLRDTKDAATVVNEFRKAFRPDGDVSAYLLHDWTADPLCNGQWACWGAKATSKYLTELQKPHGKVFFASADWADGWRGFIDGALESGKKAARDAKREIDITRQLKL
jgi:monoamine oxidase